MRFKFLTWPLLVLLAACTAGCGSYVAHRIMQAPNTYPQWLAPDAPVELAFDTRWLTNFPSQFVIVGPPEARLHYRLVPPADYGVSVSSTNWVEDDQPKFRFEFQAKFPGKTNDWTRSPRGTVVLLHGYGLAQFAMAPWALRLAQDGWRCVLVDLRGHGKSTGRRIYFGVRETGDLSQLLNALAAHGQLVQPVAAMGESYGAALALRWKTEDPRIGPLVAIAPYAVLSNSVMNIRREYAGWMPRFLIRAGLKKLPELLQVPPKQLDSVSVLNAHSVMALFIAGTKDRIAPWPDVNELYSLAASGSQMVTVKGATHEAVTYYFTDLVPPVLHWLDGTKGESQASLSAPPPNRKP